MTKTLLNLKEVAEALRRGATKIDEDIDRHSKNGSDDLYIIGVVQMSAAAASNSAMCRVHDAIQAHHHETRIKGKK